MKFVLDERLKHRLVGVAVLISLGAIFSPTLLKKSNRHIDDKVSMSVKLPPKPHLPKVNKPTEVEMFKHSTVAHVDIPSVKDELAPAITLSKAKPLSEPVDKIKIEEKALPVQLAEKKVPVAQPVLKNKPAVQISQKVVSKKTTEIAKPKAVSSPSTATTKGMYAVQLGTFTQERNAIALVSKLKTKGYSAILAKMKTKNGVVYKVLVGKIEKKQEAQLLQKKLLSVVQLNGLVVTTYGMS